MSNLLWEQSRRQPVAASRRALMRPAATATWSATADTSAKQQAPGARSGDPAPRDTAVSAAELASHVSVSRSTTTARVMVVLPAPYGWGKLRGDGGRGGTALVVALTAVHARQLRDALEQLFADTGGKAGVGTS